MANDSNGSLYLRDMEDRTDQSFVACHFRGLWCLELGKWFLTTSPGAMFPPTPTDSAILREFASAATTILYYDLAREQASQ